MGLIYPTRETLNPQALKALHREFPVVVLPALPCARRSRESNPAALNRAGFVSILWVSRLWIKIQLLQPEASKTVPWVPPEGTLAIKGLAVWAEVKGLGFRILSSCKGTV